VSEPQPSTPARTLAGALERLGRWPWVTLPVLLAYCTAVGCGLAYDDLFLETDERVTEGRLLGAWVGCYVDIPPHGDGLYRPVFLFSFALEQVAHGLRPWLLHLTNVWLHLLATLAVGRVLSRLIAPRGAAVATLLFASHPLHTEAVTWLVGRAEVLALLFAALAWHRVLAWVDDDSPSPAPRVLGRAALTTALFLLALLSKENALAFGAVIPASAWLLLRGAIPHAPREPLAAGHAARRVVVACSPLAVAAAIAVGLRLVNLGAYYTPGLALEVTPVLSDLAGLPFGARLGTGLLLLTRYLWLCLVPWHLVADYSPLAIPPAPGLLAPLPLLALLGWGTAFALAGRRARRPQAEGQPSDGVPLLALLAFGLLLFPVLNVVPIGAVFAERFAYAPSLAVCLLAGWAYLRLPTTRAWPTVLVLVLAVAGCARAAVRNPAFTNSETLFLASARDQPRSINAQLLVVSEFMRQERWEEALVYLARAEVLAPDHPPVPVRQGRCLVQLQRPAEARARFTRAAELEPDEAIHPMRSGLCALALGREDLARPDLERAAHLARDDEEFKTEARKRLAPWPELQALFEGGS
jgi:protein O-mannosyl-transferase